MQTLSKYFGKIIISFLGPIFPHKKDSKKIAKKNKTNEHFTSPSSYLSCFWIIDITGISGANLFTC